MKSPKIINLVGLPKKICEPIKFPLTNENLQEIDGLKLAFRNSFAQHKVYSLGMAAPQIAVWKRFLIMPKYYVYGLVSDFSKLKHLIRQFNVYINPKIVSKSPQQVVMNQYCLSIGFNEYKVKRPKIIEVEYYKQDGTMKTQKLDEMRSRVFQHEMDHLDGILMSQIPGAAIIPNKAQRLEKNKMTNETSDKQRK